MRDTTRRQFVTALLAGGAAAALAVRRSLAAEREDPLSFLGDALPVMPRNRWTDINPKTGRLNAAGGFHRLTVHHSGNRRAAVDPEGAVARELDGILNAHMQRSYGDIGYHFAIDHAGRVWEGRSLTFEGAHVAAENGHNVGVVLLGNFQVQKPSDAQVDAMRKLLYFVCREHRIPASRVYGHRDLGASVCPGRYLYSFVDQLRHRNPTEGTDA